MDILEDIRLEKENILKYFDYYNLVKVICLSSDRASYKTPLRIDSEFVRYITLNKPIPNSYAFSTMSSILSRLKNESCNKVYNRINSSTERFKEIILNTHASMVRGYGNAYLTFVKKCYFNRESGVVSRYWTPAKDSSTHIPPPNKEPRLNSTNSYIDIEKTVKIILAASGEEGLTVHHNSQPESWIVEGSLMVPFQKLFVVIEGTGASLTSALEDFLRCYAKEVGLKHCTNEVTSLISYINTLEL